MLDPLDPVADPLDALPRRDLPVVVVLVPPIGIDPIVLPGVLPIVLPPDEPVGVLPVMPGAVEALPVPVEVPVVIDPLAPGAAPPLAVWAPATVASRAAAVIATIVFIVLLLSVRSYCGGGLVVGVVLDTPVVGDMPGWPLTAGLVDPPGASVPTRPSPIVPADAAPIGGVTPVDGCGNAGTTGDTGDAAEPRPDGVVPGRGAAPAGE